VDGVLHVSGQPLPGAADAVQRLRDAGHRLRFVTNTTTRSKADLAAGLKSSGIDLEVGEVQTTADAAVEALRGRRVLALVMHALVGDLVATLDEFKVPEKEKNELLGALGPLAKDIVEDQSTASGTALPKNFKPAPPLKKK